MCDAGVLQISPKKKRVDLPNKTTTERLSKVLTYDYLGCILYVYATWEKNTYW